MDQHRTVEVSLNGLQIAVDAKTGCILKLTYPGVGTLLEAKPERAGGIDLAYPVKEFEALRLASRYSSGARVTKTANTLEIHWDSLGLSRMKFSAAMPVSATVRLAAAPDGESVIMTAEVTNHSDRDVRQVLFPDLSGLLPFAGEKNTRFRTAGFSTAPFIDLAKTEYRESYQYLTDIGGYSVEYAADQWQDHMILRLRWMDFGSLKGGISLFPRRWGFDPQTPVRLNRSEVETKLRLVYLHDVTIKPGESWQSGEWVLTPHRHGWAAGIQPYRAWVKQHYTREFPLPEHVRDGLGFRTIWMCQAAPADPEDAIFTFKDLPQLARECKEHGIDEMVLWWWHKGFSLPLPPAFPHLGGEEGLAKAVEDCRRIGVNVVPFISVVQANAETAPRYGLQVSGTGGWTYHTELIPRFNPRYAHGWACVGTIPDPVEPARTHSSLNPLWCADVLAGAKHLADIGIPSLSWDQLWTTADPEPNQISLIRDIRKYALKLDPKSTFSGEQLWNIEANSAVVDYTWNWGHDLDHVPFTSLFPAPRLNLNISSSGLLVRKAFADNVYMNLTPRKPESTNASDYISNHPELSKAVKQCAKLRKQFLPYFTDGTLIGDCLLTKTRGGLHASAYVLPDRVLLVLVNTSNKQGAKRVNVDLSPWLRSRSGGFEVMQYDADGALVSTAETRTAWRGNTRELPADGLMIIEFAAK